MIEVLSTLIGGAIVIAILITVIAAIARACLAALPVILVIGGLFVVGCIFSEDLSEDPVSCTVSEMHEEPSKKAKVVHKAEVIYKLRNKQQSFIHREVASLTDQKPSVSLTSIRPELDSAILVVVSAFREIMEDDNFVPIITSANDYDGHIDNSAHYSGAAVDFRIKDIGDLEKRKRLVALVSEYLDSRFVALHEDIEKMNEHLHVQMKNGTFDRNIVWKEKE